jgi:hypothetical protein
MKKEFVPHDLSLRMKALGFDEPCFGYYLEDGMFIDTKIKKQTGNAISASTYSQAFRWFRDEYKSFHEVFIDCEPRADVPLEDDLMFAFTIHRVREDKFIVGSRNIYKTHEEAELACLEKLIEIVEEKEKI